MSYHGIDRRRLLQLAAATAATGAMPHLAGGQNSPKSNPLQHADFELRRPDAATAHFGFANATPLMLSGQEWTCPGVHLTANQKQAASGAELPITISAPGGTLTHIHLRWKDRAVSKTSLIGDDWERAYGNLEWRCMVPERVMPWYFLSYDGQRFSGMGVKTQPATFCFWMRDPEGISLWIDVRNGGEPVQLGQRVLDACTVVARAGADGESLASFARAFCKQMCPAPRLPKTPLYGSNDWNYAYGKNSTAGTLRDADLIASLAPSGNSRPYIVIDDGWQDPIRFPSLPDLTAQIRSRNLHPGIWVRPIRPTPSAASNLLLPQARIGRGARENIPAYDPTIPEALHEITEQVRLPATWGFEFIKHDFSTFEIFGRWGSEMGAQIAAPGWHFQDRSKTNAEVLQHLYAAIRQAAGDDRVVLGCNTVGHIAAGVFESQRVGDDTSGREWERTRRYGVNSLAHRIAQHKTFFYVDPDCAAVTTKEDWRLASQWMDVVACTGTSLFLSPEPAAMTPEIKSAMRDAMARVCAGAQGEPADPLASTTPETWQFTQPTSSERVYQWTPPGGVAPVLVT